jgi:cytochrome c-type biogenesis protein
MPLVDFSSFILGLLTPLTAVCVLPLYPAFLAYIANQFSSGEGSKKTYALFGTLITLGVITFMLLLGLIFSTIFQVSLTKIIGIISPIAFSIMGLISLLLIFNVDFSSLLPKFKSPTSQKPKLNAFFYGFFFGAIVIPCNPAFIAAFFARALIINNFLSSMLNFLLFGLGLGFPLLLFSLLSSNWSDKIIDFLSIHKVKINRIAGLLMLGISLYYLIFVFRIFS